MMKSIPIVYEGHLETLQSTDYNTVKVNLSAKLDSDLSWDKQTKEARAISEKGMNILWDIDLGLFSELPLPLSDTTQYKSLHLALDHFFETLWKEFESNTVGAIIFKGSLDLVHKWNWDPDQILNLRSVLSEIFSDAHAFQNKVGVHCQDLLEINPQELYASRYAQNLMRFVCLASAVDYFEILAARFPESLLPYVLFDAKGIENTLHFAQLLDHEGFDFIQLALKNAPVALPHAMGWESSGYPNGCIGKKHSFVEEPQTLCQVGIVVPATKIYDPKLLETYEKVIQWVQAKERVRFISERNLTMDWSGIDFLIAFEVEEFTKRKLEGFIAAGGTVVNVQNRLHVSQEISFDDFKKQLEVS